MEYSILESTGRYPLLREQKLWVHSRRTLLCGSFWCQSHVVALGTFPNAQVSFIPLLILPRLDLTAASRAYILEPHWNPMIEEQALCRVHRVGQKRNVTTIRYMMRDSFEEVCHVPSFRR
jgi:hypothetical protein